jgi:hypothetical protein
LVLSRKGREETKGKILKDPLALPSPAAGRGEKKMKRFNGTPHPINYGGVERDEGKGKGCYSFLIVELNIFTFFLFWKISKRNSATFNCS